MTRPDEDRIIYIDQDDEPTLARSAPMAVRLAVIAVVFGMVYLAFEQLTSIPERVTPALSGIEEISELATGFDASSGDFSPCDTTQHTHPDFSIVVAGSGSGEELLDFSRVVQFVVVNTYRDYRYGRDVRAQSLCTLP